jgi:hypothetical protein
MEIDKTSDASWNRLTRFITLAMALFLVAYTAWYMHRYSDFSNDDLDWFIIMKHSSFWHFVLMPTSLHYSPLHQVFTWLIYDIGPMNFGVAIALLIFIHIGTLIYLARSMQEFKVGQAGGLIVCGYAASSFIIFGLTWWAHAEERVPYVFLDACAIFNYLAWLRNRRQSSLWIAAVAFVAAFGFYEKAVLIPLHMLVIGYLSDEARFRAQFRKVVWPPLLFALGSAAFILAYLVFMPASALAPLPLALRADLEFVKVLFFGTAGLGAESVHDVPIYGMSYGLAVLLLLGCAMFAVSFWRGRGSWKVLAGMLAVLLLDYLPIAVSKEVVVLGLGLPHNYRDYYEEIHIVALFSGLWFARIVAAQPSLPYRKTYWLIGCLLVMIYAVLNAFNVQQSRLKPLNLLWMMDHSHGYLKNLRKGLANIKNSAPVFENDLLPRYLSIFGITPDTRTLLPLFLPDVRFDDTAHPRNKVTPDGRVIRIQ